MTSRNRRKKETDEGIRLCKNRCIVCGWCKTRKNGLSLLEGAHVRPFESGNEFDKADNIIALCPNHHTEYDAFNFYIDVETQTLHFRDEQDEFNGKDVSESISHIKKEYLAYEQYLYKKENEE